MISKVLSGGQTGVDQAAWRAAAEYGIPTGGIMPMGFKTEAGNRADFGPLYGAKDWNTDIYPVALRDQYRARTRANILLADATLLLVFGPFGLDSPGTRAALKVLRSAPMLPYAVVDLERQAMPEPLTLGWLRTLAEDLGRGVTLNVGGHRESFCPGIGELAYVYLSDLFDVCTRRT